MNAQNFEDKITKLFAIATGNAQDDAKNVLFSGVNFSDFDKILGDGKLELVRAQIGFFAKTRSQMEELENDGLKDMLDSLGQEQLGDAKNLIAKYMFCAHEQKCISENELKNRCKNVIEAEGDTALAQSVTNAAENVLGEPLFEKVE